MKSKTSFFNKTIFLSLFKRFWPIFAAYLGIWIIMLPVSLQNSLKVAMDRVEYSGITDLAPELVAAEHVLNISRYGGIIMSGIFAILIAMAAYSYLYNARSVSMVCALPIKREGVFLAFTGAGILGMLGSNVITFAIAAAVEMGFGALSFTYLLQGLAAVCLMNIFFFGFAALCASFTGHILILPAVYVVLNFTASAVEFFVRLVMRILLYGYDKSFIGDFSVLSPVVGLITRTNMVTNTETLADGSVEVLSYSYSGWPLMIIYGIVGIIFTVCAMLLIKNRRMETASDVVAVKPLKPIFKYCMCVGCALVLGSAVYYAIFVGSWFFGYYDTASYGVESALYILLFMLIGAFVGYFAADMLMKKTLRVFEGKNWIGFIISAVLIAGLVVGGEYDVFGYENRIPELAEIDYVTVQCQGEPITLKETENVEQLRALHSDIVSHKLINEATQREDTYADCFCVTIHYILKNGKDVGRCYNLYSNDNEITDDVKTLSEVVNTKEAVNFRNTPSIPVSRETYSYANIYYIDPVSGDSKSCELNAEQLVDLYNNCILPDIDDGTMGKQNFFYDEAYYDSVSDCSIGIELRRHVADERGDYTYNYDYLDFTVTMNAQRTKAWIAGNLGVELISQSESNKLRYQNMSREEIEKYGYDMAPVEVDAPAAAVSVTEDMLAAQG